MTITMEKHCRTNIIYNELYKSINNNLISHTIYLDLHSQNAMVCAYNGIDYTIQSIINDICQGGNDIKLDDHETHDNHKIFCITRNNHVYTTNINLRVEKIDNKNQIMFQFHIYM
jgi:hypothetical protein